MTNVIWVKCHEVSAGKWVFSALTQDHRTRHWLWSRLEFGCELWLFKQQCACVYSMCVRVWANTPGRSTETVDKGWLPSLQFPWFFLTLCWMLLKWTRLGCPAFWADCPYGCNTFSWVKFKSVATLGSRNGWCRWLNCYISICMHDYLP